MLLFISVGVVSIGVVVALKTWAARSVNGHACGWMSEQWVMEQRLSRPV